MAGKDIKLAIKIAGEIDKSLDSSVALSKKKLNSLAVEAALATRKSEAMSKSWETWGTGVGTVTKGALGIGKAVAGAAAVGAVAVTGLGVAAVKAGSDFESAFAGIRKTVDATEGEYDQIETGIRDLAKDIPMTASALSGIGEAAGQLGIHKENLLDFTKTMADLSVATNLTADEGAAQLAKFANIVGMSQSQFSNLGSTIVALGNNMATTEADIVDMAMRIAGAGHQIGMSEADIMGFSAALSSVGIEAEMGGSALSKTMIDIQLAAESGSDELSAYADVAGMTAVKFQELFEANPAKALSAFISGIGDTERTGKSAIAVLNDLGITEVRQRDTLLRAASASDLFENSLNLANSAFEENTALTKEAEQRYATFDSRLQMVKNRISDVGISLYQDFKGPLTDIMGIALDETENVGIFDPDFMAGMAEAAQKNIPTVVRETKQLGSAIGDFVGPIASAAIGNLDYIASGIVGIGTAIAALNIVKKVKEVTSAFSAFKLAMVGNPLMMWATAASVAVGAIMGLTAAIESARKRMAEAELDQRFGDITLSMDELKDAAQQIVDDGSLARINASLEEMNKLKDIGRNFSDAAKEIDKITWKIGSGFEINETDKEQLKSSIDTAISQAQEAVSQANYTANISVQALFGEDSKAGDAIISSFDEMYEDIGSEVESKGKALGDAYSNALEDGIIDVDEARTINELQRKLATITEEITRSQTEAKMQRLVHDFTGSALTPETFQNLLEELKTASEDQIKGVQQAYDFTVGNLNLQKERGQISPAEYEKQEKAAQQQYDKQKFAVQSNGVKYAVEGLQSAFSDVIDPVNLNLQDKLDQYVAYLRDEIDNYSFDQIDFSQLNVENFLGISEIPKKTRDAMQKNWESLKPMYEDMRRQAAEMAASGMDITPEMRKTLTDSAVVGAIAGDFEAMFNLVRDDLADSGALGNLEQLMQERGYQLPQEFAGGIRSNAGAATAAVGEMYVNIKAKVSEVTRQKLFFDMPVEVRLKANVSTAGMASAVSSKAKAALNAPMKGWKDSKGNAISFHATGGLFEEPHVGMVAEDGPEAIIPLGGKRRQRGLELYEQTGELLGVRSAEKTPQPYVEPKPQVESEVQGSIQKEPLQIHASGVIYGTKAGAKVEKQSEAENGITKAPSFQPDSFHLNQFNRHGGVYGAPHMGIVAEDGPEAIIPLGGKHRQRGLELYQRAGALLGLKPAERMQPEGTESASGLMDKAGTPFVWIQQSGVYQAGMPVRLNAEGGIFGKIASGKVIERDLKSEPRPRSWNIFEIRGENIKKAEPESLRLERDEDRQSGHEVSMFERLTEALGAGSMPSEQAEALHIPEQKAAGMSEAVYQIHYAPVFNLTGAASSVANDIRQAARLSQEEFARYMQRWQKDKRRLSF